MFGGDQRLVMIEHKDIHVPKGPEGTRGLVGRSELGREFLS